MTDLMSVTASSMAAAQRTNCVDTAGTMGMRHSSSCAVKGTRARRPGVQRRRADHGAAMDLPSDSRPAAALGSVPAEVVGVGRKKRLSRGDAIWGRKERVKAGGAPRRSVCPAHCRTKYSDLNTYPEARPFVPTLYQYP